MSREWTRIDLPIFGPIRESGCTYQLAGSVQPEWAQQAHQVRRVFIYPLAPGETIPSIHTTARHAARLLSERYDPKDKKPWNYNWYGVVETPGGELYQTGPHRDVDFGHQLRTPPGFLSSYSELR